MCWFGVCGVVGHGGVESSKPETSGSNMDMSQ